MTAGRRVLRRSHDRRVSVSWHPDGPVRLFVREADGSAGEVDLDGWPADIAHVGLVAGPPSPGGVDLGWLEAPGDVRFVVDGRRISVHAGLKLLAAGIVAILVDSVRREPEPDNTGPRPHAGEPAEERDGEADPGL